jgi:hypothetical protein
MHDVLDRTILLDVDGVLGASIARGPNGVEAHVPAEIAERVRALAALAPITWATNWNPEVRAVLAEALDLPAGTDSIAIVGGPDPIEAKRRAIDRFLALHEPEGGWRAVVWIDDGIRQGERDWATASAWPLTLVAVSRQHLLTDGHIAAVREALSHA